MGEKLRIAIFGAGGICERAYLPILTTWPDIEIIGLYSRTDASVKKICRKFHLVNGTTNAQQLIDMKPDAAFVLTNDQTHFRFTEMLLKAGKDVFVEKPLAQNSKEVKFLAELAREKKKILMVGFNRRFAPLYKKAKELFRDKKIQMAIIQKHRPRATHVNLYNNYLDDTIHQIDLLRFFGGDAVPISTFSERGNEKLIGAVSVCGLKDGGIGVVMTSLKAGSWQESATLHGENTTIEVEAFEKLVIKTDGNMQVLGTDRSGKWISDLHERGFYGEIEHFFHCVDSREQPETNGDDTLQTHLLLEEMAAIGGEEPGKPLADGWDNIPRWE